MKEENASLGMRFHLLADGRQDGGKIAFLGH
jgi:hypothetical protein